MMSLASNVLNGSVSTMAAQIQGHTLPGVFAERAIQPTTFPSCNSALKDIINRSTVQSLDSDTMVMGNRLYNTPVFGPARSLSRKKKLIEKLVGPSLPNTLNNTLVQLNAPRIQADIYTISSTRTRSKTSTQTDSPTTPTHSPARHDKIRPPEEEIHDALVWDDGEWYRRRAREISFYLVDYTFWKAKETGELTDATDEEVCAGATLAAFFITLAITGNPTESYKIAGATYSITHMANQAAKNRTKRKGLGEKFGEDDE